MWVGSPFPPLIRDRDSDGGLRHYGRYRALSLSGKHGVEYYGRDLIITASV